MKDKEQNRAYWESRFRDKGLVWGTEPSEGAIAAVEFLKSVRVTPKILEVGCAYGRDMNYFFQQGYANVTGIDFSEHAVNLGRQLFPHLKFDDASFPPLPYGDSSFDLVYGYFTLHLLSQAGRLALLRETQRVLTHGGYVVHTVASSRDSDYGRGDEFEKDSFVSKRGVRKHFYTLDGIMDEFKGFDIVRVNETKIHHTHDEPHDHFNYFIIARTEVMK